VTIQIKPVEIREPIHRGVPWRPIELRFTKENGRPINLAGYDIVAEMRATESADSALVAVLGVDRDDNEGIAQPFLTAVQTNALTAAAVGGHVFGTISGEETGYEPMRVCFGEIPVLEVAAP